MNECLNCNKPIKINKKYCGLDCVYQAMHKQSWGRGPRPELRAENAKIRKYRMCCICGETTRYVLHNSPKSIQPVRCDKPECIETVRIRKNKNISIGGKLAWKLGKQERRPHPWPESRISKEEIIMHDWFVEQGWTAQFHINTKVRPEGRQVPLCYNLDFALPEKKLYVEIDGAIHKKRIETDKRRDKVMLELGWKGIRIPVTLILSKKKRHPTTDIEGVKKIVRDLVASVSV